MVFSKRNRKHVTDHALSMDNVCNCRLFSFPSKVEMAEEQEYLENMYFVFLRVIQSLVKVWENSKELWKHSPTARVPTAFLVPPNFHSCLY